VSGRISEEFWTRKSQELEAELQATEAERTRLQLPRAPSTATAEKIIELAKQAEFLYRSQDPTEQRRLLETVLSNCTFDSGTLYPTYSKPFDLSVANSQLRDHQRTRVVCLRPVPCSRYLVIGTVVSKRSTDREV
jgi:hypothetical protein